MTGFLGSSNCCAMHFAQFYNCILCDGWDGAGWLHLTQIQEDPHISFHTFLSEYAKDPQEATGGNTDSDGLRPFCGKHLG